MGVQLSCCSRQGSMVGVRRLKVFSGLFNRSLGELPLTVGFDDGYTGLELAMDPGPSSGVGGVTGAAGSAQTGPGRLRWGGGRAGGG
eukprot:363265-Chlamydomonas_euryale.AAC.4